MKKMLILSLLVSCLHLAAMEEKGKAKLLTFVKAQKGEDLSAYQDILLKVYPKYANSEGIAEHLRESLKGPFAVLASWVGQKGKCFIKVQDGQTPVGFLTIEALDEEGTQVAFHQSPLLPEHLDKVGQYFAYTKQEFPHAKEVYAACSDKVNKMKEFVKALGFVEDANYLPTKELIPNPAGFQGYKKSLE